MREKRHHDIVHRWAGNPIISLENLSFRCADICNAGAVKVGDEYILLISILSLEGVYSVYPARSRDGTRFEVADAPIMAPSPDGPLAVHETGGILDARIVELEGEHLVCYDALGRHGFRLGITRTRDFQAVEERRLISEPDAKGGVVFPRKIKGKYARLERPWEGQSIWVSYSDDLRHWGWSEVVMTPRGGFWDSTRIGCATPPLEIEQGWLFVYYGIKQTSAGPLFRLGAAILDAEEPTCVRGRTNVPILSPRTNYERIGDIPNLVFSCGAIIEPRGEVKLYYGAANSCICLGTTTVDEVADACLHGHEEF